MSLAEERREQQEQGVQVVDLFYYYYSSTYLFNEINGHVLLFLIHSPKQVLFWIDLVQAPDDPRYTEHRHKRVQKRNE